MGLCKTCLGTKSNLIRVDCDECEGRGCNCCLDTGEMWQHIICPDCKVEHRRDNAIWDWIQVVHSEGKNE